MRHAIEMRDKRKEVKRVATYIKGSRSVMHERVALCHRRGQCARVSAAFHSLCRWGPPGLDFWAPSERQSRVFGGRQRVKKAV